MTMRWFRRALVGHAYQPTTGCWSEGDFATGNITLQQGSGREIGWHSKLNTVQTSWTRQLPADHWEKWVEIMLS
jgi:hypothetical protein